MPCTVALPSSPVFSPSRIPLSCKGSPETIAIATLTSPLPSPAAAAAAAAFSGSPLRPLVLRAQLDAEVAASPSSPPTAPGSRSLLKRRKPAPLVVPPATAAAAAAAMGPVGRSEVAEEGDGFSVYCRRGKGRRRLEMEDRHVAKLDLGGDPQSAFFGVFDGHGGKRAAEFASENMPQLMAEEIKKVGDGDRGEIEAAVRMGYLRTDAEFSKEEASGGACCVTALLRKGGLVVSNAGDCRAVLSRFGKAEALTSDHRASCEDERERIENLGGFVVNYRGTWRVQGSLAVSRGIGDSHLKQWVIPDPETKTLLVDPQCEFLILASDGLWDKVSNQEAVDIARPSCVSNGEHSTLPACRRLADLAASRGSTDDISVMIIRLQHFVARDSDACSLS